MQPKKLSHSIGEENTVLYYNLSILRLRDDNFTKGIWEKKQNKEPDWEHIQDICFKHLENNRDLIVAVRLSEALTNLYGLDGLISGLDIINQITTGDFWPHDQEQRNLAFEWVNNKLHFSLLYHKSILTLIQNDVITDLEYKQISKQINKTTEMLQNKYKFLGSDNAVVFLNNLLRQLKHKLS